MKINEEIFRNDWYDRTCDKFDVLLLVVVMAAVAMTTTTTDDEIEIIKIWHMNVYVAQSDRDS